MLVAAAIAFVILPGGVMGAETDSPPDPPGSAQSASTTVGRVIRPASAETAIALIRGQGRSIVTFVGFSGAGYEDPHAANRAMAGVLDELEPTSAIIAAGATPEGIGAVYDLAKKRGFTTIGIVSAIAEKEGALFSPHVDTVFVMPDDTWGGRRPDGTLSPTSSTMVGASDEMVAIGGGEIARDEMLAAKASGKTVRYIAADMNHAAAIRKAREKHQSEPHDFRGALHSAFESK